MDPGSATSLESGSMGNWNQFEANDRLFNVKNTYDENIYTQRLDKSKISKADMLKAEKIAKEIESTMTHNSHLQEERGQKIEDDMDEEDRYSGVLRDNGGRMSGGSLGGGSGSGGQDRNTGYQGGKDKKGQRGANTNIQQNVSTNVINGFTFYLTFIVLLTIESHLCLFLRLKLSNISVSCMLTFYLSLVSTFLYSPFSFFICFSILILTLYSHFLSLSFLIYFHPIPCHAIPFHPVSFILQFIFALLKYDFYNFNST